MATKAAACIHILGSTLPALERISGWGHATAYLAIVQEVSDLWRVEDQ
jgi:hypothetical protein